MYVFLRFLRFRDRTEPQQQNNAQTSDSLSAPAAASMNGKQQQWAHDVKEEVDTKPAGDVMKYAEFQQKNKNNPQPLCSNSSHQQSVCSRPNLTGKNKNSSVGKGSVTYSELQKSEDYCDKLEQSTEGKKTGYLPQKREDYYDRLQDPTDGDYQNLPQC